MRTRRLLAAIGAPLFVVACATGTAPVVTSGDGGGGGGGGSDASSYGGDETGAGRDGGSSITDSGSHAIESGVTDSGGGGGGGGGVTAGGDCIGDPGASSGFGYDFECSFNEAFGTDAPCTPGMNQCASGDCCFTDMSSLCYADYGTQCVTAQ